MSKAFISSMALMLLTILVLSNALVSKKFLAHTMKIRECSPFGQHSYSSIQTMSRRKDDAKPFKLAKKKNIVSQRKRSAHNQEKDITHHIAAQKPFTATKFTDYDANRNREVNQQRILTDKIVCPHFETCSGCSVSHLVGQVDIIQRSAKQYFSSTAVQRKRVNEGRNKFDDFNDDGDDATYPVIVPSPVTRWRTQAKLAVAAPPSTSSWTRNAGCIFGLYQRKTHTVMNIPGCVVHHPSINQAVLALEEATRVAGTVPFSTIETSPKGTLRYVQMQVERSSKKVCLTLVWNAEHIKEAQPALSRLVKALQRSNPTLWHSIWCHCNDSPGNSIFSRNIKRWYRIWGPQYVREPIPALNIANDKAHSPAGWFYFTPFTFRQGNLDGFDILALDVARAVPGGSKVCELYAGVGFLGLTALAYHAQQQLEGNGDAMVWLRCSDENPSNPDCFNLAVDSLPPSITGRHPFHGSSVDKGKTKLSTQFPENDEMTLAELATLMNQSQLQTITGQRKQQTRGEKTSYMIASATQALQSGQALGAQILIVDPPRKGLDDGVLNELCKPYNSRQPYVESTTFLSIPDFQINWVNDVEKLIYVSCGFDALARDSERLLSSNARWRLKSSTGYVLFPGSDHVETLCIFERD